MEIRTVRRCIVGKRILQVAGLFVVIAISAATVYVGVLVFGPRVPPPEVKPPAAVFPAGFPQYLVTFVEDVNGRPVAVGSGFLVDRRRGLVATAAHLAFDVVGNKGTITAFIGTQRLRADIVRQLIDADSDTALLRLRATPDNLAVLPLAARLAPEQERLYAGDRVTVYGAGVAEEEENGILERYYRIGKFGDIRHGSVPLKVERVDCSYGDFSLDSAIERLELVIRMKSGYIPAPKERSVLYEHYIIVEYAVGRENTGELSGYSGGPLVREDGAVAAVLVAGSDSRHIAVPVGAVYRLLARIPGTRQRR